MCTMAKIGDQIGGWTLRRVIGSGGQGQVFAASKEEGGEETAVKIITLRPAQSKKRARFILEVTQHAALSSEGAANIIKVIEHNLSELEAGGRAGYVVMPVAATSLEKERDLLAGRVELCLEIFLGVANGIHNAHAKGVVHRDIKPGNVLFLDRSLRNPLVSDFGICLLRETPDEERLTEVGESVGPRLFMAPEQEQGGIADITTGADAYALGKLLHHILTNRVLYREELDGAFTESEMASDPRYAQIRERILAKTVLRDPNLRIQSAKVLCEIAQDILSGGRTPSGPSGGGTVPTPRPPSDSGNGPDVKLRAFGEFSVPLSEGKLGPAKLELDRLPATFMDAWGPIHEEFKNAPRDARKAAVALIERQPRTIALFLATARFDQVELYRPLKRFLEVVLRSSERQAGYPAVFTVPHVFAGFLYMATSLIALHFESWKLLRSLLTEKFEWYYQSSKPHFSFGFALSYFFHPEALGRTATETHNLYRESLSADSIVGSLGLREEALLEAYLQIQFIMSLRGAQLVEQGEDVPLWPDFGRFHGYRIEPLLQRTYHDGAFSKHLLESFGETREVFFSKLNGRLALLRNRFGGSNYFWDSVKTWEP